jgi:2-polyprenyl-3-methyl-5-hydroxy-6-metoxy-1,4-benzoquinol methylase
MKTKNEENRKAHDAWNTNARFWDEHMGEGNSFFNILIWPAVERLLSVRTGARVLDIACGNGVTSRRLHKLGAKVVAVDFSEELLEIARKREYGSDIDYRLADVTDYQKLIDLGSGDFDAVLCNMALMDIADIHPLTQAAAKLLQSKGVYVFSTLHPCFNNPSTIQMAELEDREGEFEMTYSVKISRYLAPYTRLGAAMHDQPAPHPYFHRSLSDVLTCCFESGFAMDAFEEQAFTAGQHTGTTFISWGGSFSEIPPILVVRMRSNG